MARDRGLQQITEENDLKAYQADPSGFLWAVLEVLRHTDAFAEPDFQALIERGRLAALGQRGMMDHSDDVRKVDQEERQRAFEQSEPGVGPPRSVMPGEGDSPMAEAQRLADQDPRAIEAAERQSEAERLGVTAPTASPEVRQQTEAAEDAALGKAPQPEADDALDAEDEDEDEERDERAEAEQKAAARGLEIRDFGTAGEWRVYDPKTGRMVARSVLDEPA